MEPATAGPCVPFKWLIRPQSTTRPLALSSSSGLDSTRAQGGSTSHLDQHGCSDGLVLGHQQGLRLWPKPWASVWPLVATWVTNINTDPGCYRATDMALSSSSGLDNSMPLDGSTGRSLQPGSRSGPQTPTWPEGTSQILSIPLNIGGNLDYECQHRRCL